jgi:plastocyanin
MKLAALLVAAALALPGSAGAATYTVSAQFQSFGPTPLDILPGESVQWENASDRNHTVTADDGSFDTPLGPGETFTHAFDTAGEFAYHCTIHAGMVGEVDVRPVILGPLPTAAVPAGNQVEFEGRTADAGNAVRIERSTGGAFQTIGTAMPAADGSWKTNIAAQSTGDYRAEVDAGFSETRHLIVSDRKVLLRATRRGVTITVTPALPYARVLLEQDLRERFGWWPLQWTRLDYVSQAAFRVARPARVRVLLVDKDGWTALATSAVMALGHVGHSHPKAMPMPMPMPMPMHH